MGVLQVAWGRFVAGLVMGLASACAQAVDHCFDQAAHRYGVSSSLLRAIARVESSMNPAAVNASHVERTGTRDLGLMQVNTSHLRSLAAYGIDERRLLDDPCTNVHVGAWILADTLARHGDGWEAVGAYNAACSQLKGDACQAARRTYAWKVHRALQQELQTRSAPSAQTLQSPSSSTRQLSIAESKQ
jgi:hypothetical protein